jgi:hypothetical protein
MNKAKWKSAKRERGAMNRLEAAYAKLLEERKAAGQIADYRFEAMKLRLADLTYLTPDFVVLTCQGWIEFHECKGGWFPEHNRCKWKFAIEQFPWFTFVLVRSIPKKNGGGFEYERFE